MSYLSIFKIEHTFEKRLETANRILTKFADRIPVILDRDPKSRIPDIERKKYLVPCDITVGKFMYEIRKSLKINSEQSIYFIINDMIPNASHTMASIYQKHKDDDKFLYITYSGENTFGNK